MEKWKMAAIVALLAALPVYGYFQSKPMDSPPPTPTGSPENDSEAMTKPAPSPPAHLQDWWGKKPVTFSFPKELWTNTDKPLKVEDFKGKVVLLEFWRAECSHCQIAAPIIESWAEQYKAEGLQVIGVHSSATPNTIEYDWPGLKKWIKDRGIKYPVAFDENRTVFEKFKAKKYPTFFIIDRQGVIRYAHEGMTIPLKTELQAALKQVLAGKNPVWPPSKQPAADAALKYAPDKN